MSEDWSEHMEEDLTNALKLLEKDKVKFRYPRWKYDILMSEFKQKAEDMREVAELIGELKAYLRLMESEDKLKDPQRLQY